MEAEGDLLAFDSPVHPGSIEGNIYPRASTSNGARRLLNGSPTDGDGGGMHLLDIPVAHPVGDSSALLPSLLVPPASAQPSAPQPAPRPTPVQQELACRTEGGRPRAFNFSDFLEKMRKPQAFELVKAVKTFIMEHGARTLPVDEYVRLVREFLDRTTQQLVQHPLWLEVDDSGLENAAEGLEKYVMNKMYSVCFQPRLSDDIWKDQALLQRMELLSFVKPEHLDIPEKLCKENMLDLAMKELCKLDRYKAPRDKMVCILNCCKIINNLLQTANEHAGADEFMPLLIFVTLKARPVNLYSHLMFIERFRHPDRLGGEPGYYYTMLMAAVEFAQTMNAKGLSIDQEKFDELLNEALQAHETILPPVEAPAPLSTPAPVPGVTAQSAAAPSPSPSIRLPATAAPKAGRSARKESQSSLLSVGDDELSELLVAVSEPPVAKFLSCNVEDLSMVDIPLLLADYKRLAALNDRLARTLNLNVAL